MMARCHLGAARRFPWLVGLLLLSAAGHVTVVGGSLTDILVCDETKISIFTLHYITCPFAGTEPTTQEEDACNAIADEISQLSNACYTKEHGTATGVNVELDQDGQQYFLGYNHGSNIQDDVCDTLLDGATLAIQGIMPNFTSSVECLQGKFVFFSQGGGNSDECNNFVGLLGDALASQVENGTCLFEFTTTVTSTVTSTATSSATSTKTSTASSTGTTSVTSTQSTTATSSMSSTATTSQSSTATTTQSSTATSTHSTTATSTQSSTATSTHSSTATSTQSSTRSSTATTTPTTTPHTTNYRTPLTPVVECLFPPLQTTSNTAVNFGQLSDNARQRLGQSYGASLLARFNELYTDQLIDDSIFSTITLTRGRGEHRGMINARAHMINGGVETRGVGELIAAAASNNPVLIEDGAVSATSLECALIDGRVSADLMFRAYAHRKYGCEGTPPEYAYWVV